MRRATTFFYVLSCIDRNCGTFYSPFLFAPADCCCSLLFILSFILSLFTYPRPSQTSQTDIMEVQPQDEITFLRLLCSAMLFFLCSFFSFFVCCLIIESNLLVFCCLGCYNIAAGKKKHSDWNSPSTTTLMCFLAARWSLRSSNSKII